MRVPVRRIAALVPFVLASLAPWAVAAPVTWQFTAHITFVAEPDGPYAQLLDSDIIGWLSFDSDHAGWGYTDGWLLELPALGATWSYAYGSLEVHADAPPCRSDPHCFILTAVQGTADLGPPPPFDLEIRGYNGLKTAAWPISPPTMRYVGPVFGITPRFLGVLTSLERVITDEP